MPIGIPIITTNRNPVPSLVGIAWYRSWWTRNYTSNVNTATWMGKWDRVTLCITYGKDTIQSILTIIFFTSRLIVEGYTIIYCVTFKFTTSRSRRYSHRRRGDIDPRGIGGAGTVRVAHDQQGHPDHHHSDRNFFLHRNRSRCTFILRSVGRRRDVGERNGLIRRKHGIVWCIVCLWI